MAKPPDNAPPPASETEPQLRDALQRLAADRGRGRVPFVQQMQWTDCGPACLTMVLRMLGHEIQLDAVRDVVGVGRDGSDAADLIAAGERYGLRGRGLSLDVEHMTYLPAGSILHWEFKHFVVFERLTKKGAMIVDPAMGPRLIPFDQLRKSFTGVAVVFEVTSAFEPRRADQGRLSWYFDQIKSQRHLLSRIMVTSLLLRVFALALPLITALIIDRVIGRSDRGLLMIIVVGVTGVLLFQATSTLIRTHLFLQLRTNLDSRMTMGFVSHLAKLPYEFFMRRPTGDLMMRVNSNAQIRETLTSNTLSTLLDGFFVLAYLVLIFTIEPLMGGVVLVLAAIQTSVFLVTRRTYKEQMARSLEAQSRTQSFLLEMISGIATLKASAAEGRAVERWANHYVDEMNVSLERGRTAAVVDGINGFLTAASPLVLLFVGAARVMDNSMSLGTMLAVNAIGLGVLSPLSSLVSSALQLQTMGSYVDRIEDVLRQPPEQIDPNLPRVPRLTGAIDIQDVSFRYSNNTPLVLRNVHLKIKAGMSVAIVGKSGCGKSTLAALIAGTFRPSDGKISYDGFDLTRVDLTSFRRQLGVVFQQPTLFAGSVRQNLALTQPSAPLARLERAAELAAIHHDIDAMPMGYETVVNDGGASLSGGQRQRIAIARALVHDPVVLILDEATSALDAKTEAEVIKNLKRLRCTQIILAHRLSTIAAADLIVMMEAGQIIEQGSHEALMAKGGAYAELVRIQVNPGDDHAPLSGRARRPSVAHVLAAQAEVAVMPVAPVARPTPVPQSAPVVHAAPVAPAAVAPAQHAPVARPTPAPQAAAVAPAPVAPAPVAPAPAARPPGMAARVAQAVEVPVMSAVRTTTAQSLAAAVLAAPTHAPDPHTMATAVVGDDRPRDRTARTANTVPAAPAARTSAPSIAAWEDDDGEDALDALDRAMDAATTPQPTARPAAPATPRPATAAPRRPSRDLSDVMPILPEHVAEANTQITAVPPDDAADRPRRAGTEGGTGQPAPDPRRTRNDTEPEAIPGLPQVKP